MTNGEAYPILNTIRLMLVGVGTIHISLEDRGKVDEAFDMALSVLSENKGDWIPVYKRLPEIGVSVLCACQGDIYEVLELTIDGWKDLENTYMLGFVKAWKPYTPYEAESEEV